MRSSRVAARSSTSWESTRARACSSSTPRSSARRSTSRPPARFPRRITSKTSPEPSSRGGVVPVLGADVAELTLRLAQRFGYPEDGGRATLPSVAQYVAVMKGSGPLYDELHELLDADLPPTPLHRFLASLPPLLRERGLPPQVVVTTSYDTALETGVRGGGRGRRGRLLPRRPAATAAASATSRRTAPAG